ncbi:hypothetical protein BT63DRAFT_459941 [Microthyrium microscopicum]|uniref:Uncharacterized protein n=1 Tax=Microthyrium microscopicum TaxID=703497 RepID=A0A6A6TZM9_9PEZI|nr:hypothetical protein BT63DRAFT_459941 [Microthyrium microscopicum]
MSPILPSTEKPTYEASIASITSITSITKEQWEMSQAKNRHRDVKSLQLKYESAMLQISRYNLKLMVEISQIDAEQFALQPELQTELKHKKQQVDCLAQKVSRLETQIGQQAQTRKKAEKSQKIQGLRRSTRSNFGISRQQAEHQAADRRQRNLRNTDS